MYINAIPAEQDANAAAAMFLRDHHVDAIEKLCLDRDNQMLACSLVGPQPLDTLPARMVAFAFMYADCCDMVAERYDGDFAGVLEGRFGGTGDVWGRLSQCAG